MTWAIWRLLIPSVIKLRIFSSFSLSVFRGALTLGRRKRARDLPAPARPLPRSSNALKHYTLAISERPYYLFSGDLRMQRKQILSLVMVAIAAAGATCAFADDPCIGFKWDVRKEHALFGGAPAALSAGK